MNQSTPSSSSRQVRVGLIGPGTQARSHLLPSIRLLQDTCLQGISSRSLERARCVAERWGALFYTDNWRDLCDRDRVDAIVACGEPQLHSEVAEFCVPRGIHVFLEKPPAPDSGTLRRLVELEAAYPDVVAFVGFNFHFAPLFRQLAETMNGEGGIQMINLRFVSSQPRSPAAGHTTTVSTLLYQLGIHPVALATSAFGDSISLHASRCDLSDGRVVIHMDIGFSPDHRAVIEVGNYAHRFECQVSMVARSGACGSIEQNLRLRLSVPSVAGRIPQRLDGKESIVWEWSPRRGGFERDGTSLELASFRDSVLHGTPSASSLASCTPTYSILDQVLEAIDRS